MNRFTILLTLCWSSMLLPARAQQLRPESLGIREGLSQGFVTAIHQDAEGFLWLATPNGLNRYDGYRFRLFQHDPLDSFSLSHNQVASIQERGGFLLLGTLGGGLNLYHKATERFYRLPFEACEHGGQAAGPYEADALPGERIIQIHLDRHGNVWLLATPNTSMKWYMVKISVPKGFWAHAPAPGWAPRMDIAVWETPPTDREGYLGILPAEGLVQGPPVAEVIVRTDGHQNYALWDADTHRPLRPLPGQALAKWPKRVVKADDGTGMLIQDDEGRTWFLGRDGRWVAWPNSLPVVLKMDSTGLWVFRDHALGYVPMAPGRLWPHHERSYLWYELSPQETFREHYLDRAGNFWWAHLAQGVIKLNARKAMFQHLMPGRSIMFKPCAAPGKGYLLILERQILHLNPGQEAEKWSGVNAFMAKGGYFASQIVRSPVDHGIWLLLTKPEGTLFLGHVTPGGDPPNPIYDLGVKSSHQVYVHMDGGGRAWLAISGKLICLDTRTGVLAHFDYGHLPLSPSHVAIDLQWTPDSILWVATTEGLMKAQPIAGGFSFSLLQSQPGNPATLNQNSISSLCPDPIRPHLLWMGTKGGGLNCLDTRTLRFSRLTTREGLPDNVVYGILPDRAGNLWLSTNRGLVCYHPLTGRMRRYREADGLQNDEFNTFAFNHGPYGEMLFGGVNGLTVFFPEAIVGNPAPPNTVLTGLKINNRPIQTLPAPSQEYHEAAIPFGERIVLPHDDNNLIIEFASLDFSSQGKNRYRFYMEGAEEEWANEGELPFASYTNLRPGRYTFRVLGSNDDLTWSLKPAQLAIVIHPPWYATTAANVLYCLLGGGLLFWFVNNRERRLHLQIALEREKNEAKEATLAFQQKQLEALQLARQLEENKQKLLALTEQLLDKARQSDSVTAEKAPEDVSEEGILPDPDLYRMKLLTQTDWEHWRYLFEQAHPGFSQRLATLHPELTTGEVRLLMLAKLGLQRADAASILGVTPEAVKKAGQRLRRKIGREEDTLREIAGKK